MQPDDKEKLLRQSPVFEILGAQAQHVLGSQAIVRRFSAGEVIFRQGDPAQSLMAVAEGTVRVGLTTPTGREVVLADMAKGEVLGEIALLDGGERSADARALTNCTLVALHRPAFLEMLMQEPSLAIGVIELLCRRVRHSDTRMVEFAFLDLPSRLARTVLRAAPDPALSGHGRAVKLSLSQSELADMIGSSRENVNRCLRRWQNNGIVDLKDGWLIVRDIKALKLLAE